MAYQPYISLTFLHSCLLLSLHHPHLVSRLHQRLLSTHHPKLCVLPASILLITLNGKVIYPIGFNPYRPTRSYPVIPLVTTLHSSDSAVPQALHLKANHRWLQPFYLHTLPCYYLQPDAVCATTIAPLRPTTHTGFFLSTTIGSVMCPPADAQGSTPWSLR